MTINNVQMLNIYEVLERLFNSTNDIKLKWKLSTSKLTKEIYEIKSQFEQQKEFIIQEYGQEKDGQKFITRDNIHFVELLKCESEVSTVNIDDLDGFNLTLEDMIILSVIIQK